VLSKSGFQRLSISEKTASPDRLTPPLLPDKMAPIFTRLVVLECVLCEKPPRIGTAAEQVMFPFG